MRLSGFADEAADGIEGQILVTKALGWGMIEARNVQGINIHDLDDAGFETVRRALEEAEIRINCFGSTIANWGTALDEDHELALAKVRRSVRRMKILAAPHVRIMSYAILYDHNGRVLPDQRAEERFAKLKEICFHFLDAGITPLHENCLNYGGMSWEHTLRLLDAVTGLKLIYDTGNPALTPDFRKSYPYPSQDSWETYSVLRPYIEHVHIKDGVRDRETGEETYCFPGEGRGEVERVLADLLTTGYQGVFSIEPHMAVVFHDQSVTSPEATRCENYLEYGHRTEAMLRRLAARVESTK